jgi:hypothetical protein
MNTNSFVRLLSHDEVIQDLAPGFAAPSRLDVQPRFLKEGLPDGDCRALVVDLDSVAPGRLALQRLVKELSGRPHPYPVAASCCLRLPRLRRGNRGHRRRVGGVGWAEARDVAGVQ